MTTHHCQISELIQHSAWVERLARCLVRDPNVADDLVQETWVKALKSPRRLAGSVGSGRAFLGSVVRNLVRQAAREDRHRRGREQSRARDEAVPAAASLVAAADSQRALIEEVLGLPELQRDTLLLRFFQDLSSAEIARRTEVSAATVRSRLMRGLEELRTRLDAKAGGDAEPWLLALTLAAPSGTGAVALPTAAAPFSLLTALMTKTHLVATISAITVACGIAAVFQLGSSPDLTETGPVDEVTSSADREAAPPAGSRGVPHLAQTKLMGLRESGELPRVAALPREQAEPGVRAVFVDGLGQPLPGVRLRRNEGAGVSLTVRSNARGEALLPCETGLSTATISWRAAGFLSGAREVALLPGEVTSLGEIVLMPEAVLLGRVVDKKGRPVRDASVWTAPPMTIEAADERRTRRLGPGPPNDPTSLGSDAGTQTDGQGRFRVAGVRPGVYAVWAHRRDSEYGWATPVEAGTEPTSEPVEIVLAVLDRTERIEGVVQDALGRPYSGADVTYSVFDGKGSSMSSSVTVDEQGRFLIKVQLSGGHDLVADDPSADLARPMRAYANSVEPGTLDVVLRLGEAPLLNLRLRDGKGTPVEAATVIPMIGDQTSRISVGAYPGPHAGGFVELPKPGRSFYLRVSAPGYRTQELGPLEPEAIDSVLDIELLPAPRVMGTVTANGRPVPGARVGLFRPVAPGAQVRIHGLAVNFSPQGPSVTTAQDGRFELHHEQAGPYLVIAQHDDFAAAESGVIQLIAGEDLVGLELESGQGGSLVVHAPKGTDPGATVIAHRGVGDPLRGDVDRSGTVIFEHLAAGRWHVQLESPQLRENRGRTEHRGAVDDQPVELPWNCEVRAGQRAELRLP